MSLTIQTMHGDVVVIADRAGEFTGKPRPAVIVQSDLFLAHDTVTVCPIVSEGTGMPIFRLALEPGDELPLDHASYIAIDKVTTIRRRRIGNLIGRLAPEDLLRIRSALAVWFAVG